MKKYIFFLIIIFILLFGRGSLSSAEEISEAASLYNCLFPVDEPTLDGEFTEPFWKDAPWQKVSYDMGWNTPDNDTDGSLEFACAADREYLYVGVRIWDDIEVIEEDIGDSLHNDDSIEIYIDGDNSKSSDYEKDVSQIIIGRYNISKTTPFAVMLDGVEGKSGLGIPAEKTGTVAYVINTDYGWAVEVALPLKTWNIELKDGAIIGFNIQLNDDDDGGMRDHKLSWSAKELSGSTDTSWLNPSVFGELKFEAVR